MLRKVALEKSHTSCNFPYRKSSFGFNKGAQGRN